MLCSQRWRETREEQRELERLNFEMVNEVRQAAEVHRQVPALRQPARLAVGRRQRADHPVKVQTCYVSPQSCTSALSGPALALAA